MPREVTPFASLLCLQAMRRWKAGGRLPEAERERLNHSNTGFEGVSHTELIASLGLDQFDDQVLDPEADQRDLMALLRTVASDVDQVGWAQNRAG